MSHQSQTIYSGMKFNNTYKLTVFKDCRESGKEYWRILHGQELLEGFEVGDGYRTREDALDVALGVLSYASTQGTFLPLIAYQHGSEYRWLCRDAYLKHGIVKSH